MSRPSRRAKPTVLSRKAYRKLASEHSLQASLLEFLALNARQNVFWFAIPNAGKRSWHVARRMKVEGLTAGVADICIMLPGGSVLWLELKTARGRQGVAQRAFEAVCDRLGHPYLLIRDLPEAIDGLNRWCVLKGKYDNDRELRSSLAKLPQPVRR